MKGFQRKNFHWIFFIVHFLYIMISINVNCWEIIFSQLSNEANLNSALCVWLHECLQRCCKVHKTLYILGNSLGSEIIPGGKWNRHEREVYSREITHISKVSVVFFVFPDHFCVCKADFLGICSIVEPEKGMGVLEKNHMSRHSFCCCWHYMYSCQHLTTNSQSGWMQYMSVCLNNLVW